MRLAFCLYRYFPYSGLSRDFLRIMEECRERDHDLHAYVSEWQGPRPRGIRINLLPVLPLSNHLRLDSFYRQFSKARRTVGDFDAVIGFNKMPGLDLYYGGDICYAEKMALRSTPLHRLTPRYYGFRAFERAVFGPHSHTAILSLSEREKGIYQQYYCTAENRFIALPPTLDKNRMPGTASPDAMMEKRRELGIRDDRKLLLFIGSGFRTKGLDRVLRAMAALPHGIRETVHLLVVGQDRKRPYEGLASRNGLARQVRFLGGRDDVMEIMAAGDILVHPAYRETTGTVLIEAMIAGLPILVTDVCGYADHVARADAGTVLKSPFDQGVLNRTLESMLVSNDRERWRDNGKRYARDPGLYRMPEAAADAIESRATACRRGAPKPHTPVPDRVVYLDEELRDQFSPGMEFEQVMTLEGLVVRDEPSRRTIRLDLSGQSYYLKTHSGVGWREVLKNLVYLRMPVLGAANEWHGIHHLERMGIHTMTATGFGKTSGNPASQRSFLLTRELKDCISLESYCAGWGSNPPRTPGEIRFKRWLISQVAGIARAIHQSGANHRDFYLCHFLLRAGFTRGMPDPEKSRLHVIDLHRMQIRKRTPSRWIVKDLAGLYFSSHETGLTTRDLYRFMSAYRSGSAARALTRDRAFWGRVKNRGIRLYDYEKRKQVRREKADRAVSGIR